MGYTHYWYRPKELDANKFKLFVDDVREIIRQTTEEKWHGKIQDIVIRGGDGRGMPEITDDIISFNGDADTGHVSEAFCINRVEKEHRNDIDKLMNRNDGTYFRFCKTNLEPYDIVVVASLVAFKYHFGDQVKIKFATSKLEDIRDGILLAEDVIGLLDANFIETLIKKDWL